MCQIFWCPEGELPPADVLWDAAESNSDGAGFAFSREDGVEFHKGYDTSKDGEWQEFMADLDLAKGKSTLIHFRWATHGGEVPELTHPFIASPRSPLKLDGVTPQVIVHNGVYHDCYEDMKIAVLAGQIKMLEGEVSDSRILAALIGRFGWGITSLLRGLKGDKVALLRANGKAEFFGPWQKAEDGEYWYSNAGQFAGKGRRRKKVDLDMMAEDAWKEMAAELREEDAARSSVVVDALPQQTVPVSAVNAVTKEAVQVGLYKITKDGWKFTPASD